MQIINHASSCVAMLEESDLARARENPAALLEEAIKQGCAGFIVPGSLLKSALPLLKSGLLDALREQFATASFRAAIVAMPGGLVSAAVKTLVKAYHVGDSVFFVDSVEEGLKQLRP